MHKPFQVLTLVCAMAAGLIGSASAVAEPVYKVGATATGIPFTFLDIKSGKIQGMMVDAAEVFDVAAREKPGQIARPIEAPAGNP